MSSADFGDILLAARGGDKAAFGRLLERYRNYLRLLAQAQIGSGLGARLDASDLVQEACLEAVRDFPRFAGHSAGEMLQWLRRILTRNLADQLKHHRAARRNLERQESLEALLERSSIKVHEALADGIVSPSGEMQREENAVLLANAIYALPEAQRQVIIYRHIDRLPFEEIAGKLNRSASAARMLWARALENLRDQVEGKT